MFYSYKNFKYNDYSQGFHKHLVFEFINTYLMGNTNPSNINSYKGTYFIKMFS